MGTMRKQFESWILSSKVCVSKGAVVKVRADGHYTDGRVDLQWKAWQASRDALCILMPRCWNDEQRDYRDDILDHLDDAGVRYE